MSFFSFRGYLGHFQVSRVYRSFLTFRGYVGHFLSLVGISVIFRFGISLTKLTPNPLAAKSKVSFLFRIILI